MKIYEIVEAPELDKAEPDSNVNPAPQGERGRDRFGGEKSWNRDDLNQVRQAYARNPELLNLIQIALQMPHIKTMQQAVDYANTELALRTKKGTIGDRDPVPMRTPKKTAYKGPEGGVAQTEPARNRLDRFAGYTKDLPKGLDPEDTPLGKIASAGKDIVAQTADAANKGLDIATGGAWNSEKVQGYWDEFSNIIDKGLGQGRAASRTITTKGGD